MKFTDRWLIKLQHYRQGSIVATGNVHLYCRVTDRRMSEPDTEPDNPFDNIDDDVATEITLIPDIDIPPSPHPLVPPEQPTHPLASPTLAIPQEAVLQAISPAVLQQAIPQAIPQQAIPQQAMPQQAVPQAIPQQAMPQQAMPQQAMPQQAVPQDAIPQAIQTVPQQAMPQAVSQQIVSRQAIPSAVPEVRRLGQVQLTVVLIGIAAPVFNGVTLGGRFSNALHMMEWLVTHKSMVAAMREAGIMGKVNSGHVLFVDPSAPPSSIAVPQYPGECALYIARIQAPSDSGFLTKYMFIKALSIPFISGGGGP